MHEEAVLRVFPEIVTFITRNPDLAKGDGNRTQTADLIRPRLESRVDLLLDVLRFISMSFEERELRIQDVKFTLCFRRDVHKKWDEFEGLFVTEVLRLI